LPLPVEDPTLPLPDDDEPELMLPALNIAGLLATLWPLPLPLPTLPLPVLLPVLLPVDAVE